MSIFKSSTLVTVGFVHARTGKPVGERKLRRYGPMDVSRVARKTTVSEGSVLEAFKREPIVSLSEFQRLMSISGAMTPFFFDPSRN